MTCNSRLATAALLLGAALPALADTVLLRDDFSDPRSGWPNQAATRSGDLGFAVYTDTGGYQLTPVADHAFGFIAAPQQPANGDSRTEAELFLYAGLGAGAGGIACRFKDHGNFYGFLAFGNQRVAIIKVKDGQVTPLAQGSIKSVVPGSVDTRLTAECRGDRLILSARGGSTLQATDADFQTGKTGLMVAGEQAAGTSASFDNLALTELSGR